MKDQETVEIQEETPQKISYAAFRYYYSRNTEKDPDRAAQLFKKSAMEGSVAEWYNYAIYLAETGDFNQAYCWALRSAGENFVPAQALLACFYADGIGTFKDEREAFRLFKLAAQSGHLLAQKALAQYYLFGIGCEKDFEAAFNLFLKTEYRSQNWLGYCYALGIGTQKDENTALKYFGDAGILEGNLNEIVCYKFGIGAKKNVRFAKILYSMYSENLERLKNFFKDNIDDSLNPKFDEISAQPTYGININSLSDYWQLSHFYYPDEISYQDFYD